MFRSSPAEPVEAPFTAHFDPIYRFAKCRVGQDEALDIAAETLLKPCAAPPAGTSPGTLDPGCSASRTI